MEGSKHDDLRRQLKEYEAENRGLREQLEQAESEIDRLRGENEQLRKELKAAGRGPKHGTNSRKRKGVEQFERGDKNVPAGSLSYELDNARAGADVCRIRGHAEAGALNSDAPELLRRTAAESAGGEIVLNADCARPVLMPR